jgi:RND family efflux transporter MFP subunit
MSSDTDPDISDVARAEIDGQFVQHDAWTRLLDAPSAEAFAAAWLELQCAQFSDIRTAAVLLSPGGAETLSPIAVKPNDAHLSPSLILAAESAAEARRGVVNPRREGQIGGPACAIPLIVDNVLRGIAVFELSFRSQFEPEKIMRQLQWGLGWLEALVRRKHPGAREQLVEVLDLVAQTLEPPRFKTAASALVAELARRLNCDRVSLGRIARGHARVIEVSNSATFARKSGALRLIGAAMDESAEQCAVVRYPLPKGGARYMSRAQEALARHRTKGAVLSVPLHAASEVTGVLVLEREAPFTDKEASMLEHLAAMAGPALEAKRLNDRWLSRKVWDSLVAGIAAIVGPRHIAAKLVFLVVLGVVGFAIFAQGEFRVTASASLDGTVRRAVTAPVDGFVDEALTRAGDQVAQGQLMARLDDDELQLERVRWLSEKAQLERKYREAFAAGDRAESRIIAAQIDGADARLALIEEQLRRTVVVAPIEGIVISGDLSQSLGSPVTLGDVLFEVAPLNRFRVVVQVDERDMSFIKAGQEGNLVLASLPDERFAFTVEKITPVASLVNGLNTFRIEAKLNDPDPRLRPGMEGVAKIDIGERRLSWIWTQKFWWWLKLQSWRWWPYG